MPPTKEQSAPFTDQTRDRRTTPQCHGCPASKRTFVTRIAYLCATREGQKTTAIRGLTSSPWGKSLRLRATATRRNESTHQKTLRLGLRAHFGRAHFAHLRGQRFKNGTTRGKLLDGNDDPLLPVIYALAVVGMIQKLLTSDHALSFTLDARHYWIRLTQIAALVFVSGATACALNRTSHEVASTVPSNASQTQVTAGNANEPFLIDAITFSDEVPDHIRLRFTEEDMGHLFDLARSVSDRRVEQITIQLVSHPVDIVAARIVYTPIPLAKNIYEAAKLWVFYEPVSAPKMAEDEHDGGPSDAVFVNRGSWWTETSENFAVYREYHLASVDRDSEGGDVTSRIALEGSFEDGEIEHLIKQIRSRKIGPLPQPFDLTKVNRITKELFEDEVRYLLYHVRGFGSWDVIEVRLRNGEFVLWDSSTYQS